MDINALACGPGALLERAIDLHINSFHCLPLRIEMHPAVMFDLAMRSIGEKYARGEVHDYYCGVRIVENPRMYLPSIVAVNGLNYLV